MRRRTIARVCRLTGCGDVSEPGKDWFPKRVVLEEKGGRVFALSGRRIGAVLTTDVVFERKFGNERVVDVERWRRFLKAVCMEESPSL